MFSNAEVLAKLEELDVELIVCDDTKREPRHSAEIGRCDRTLLPVNLIYPPNYPQEPAILIDALFSPADALKVLGRMEKIQNGTTSSFSTSP